MTDIRSLIKKMAAQETSFAETQFVAPCVRGGNVRARVGGIVQTFPTDPADFEGWGVFQARDGERGPGTQRSWVAAVVEEADLPLVDKYRRQFPRLRLRLARQLAGLTWLAYPTGEADMRQRFGDARPVAVHLVTDGTAFEAVTAHNVGGAWWFEEVDRRADPLPVERLRDALNATTDPDALAFPGLTPEMRTVYELVAQADARFQAAWLREREQETREQRDRAEAQWRADHPDDWYYEAYRERDPNAPPPLLPQPADVRQEDGGRRRRNRGNPANARDENRIRGALSTGGGDLRDYTDRGEYWLVEWTDNRGNRHTSAIAKSDLTVISSGICLSGRDRDFDLQSLVGVIERR